MTNRMYIIFSLITIYCCNIKVLALSNLEFIQLQKLVNDIESAYNITPKNYKNFCIIGIGRSPTPVIAYLQNIYRENFAYNIPLTKFKYRKNELREKNLLLKLYEHLNIYFPQECLNHPQIKIVIIDFAGGGNTLISTYNYMKQYLSSKKVYYQLYVYYFIEQYDEPGDFKDRAEKKIKRAIPNKILKSTKLSKPNKVLHSFNHSSYDKFSQYGKFDLEKDKVSAKISSSEKYIRFSQEIKNLIAKDKELKKKYGLFYKIYKFFK